MAEMRPAEFHRRLAALIDEARSFATARLVEVRGSVPQAPGAAMIVLADGSIEGTIGGGRFEAAVALDALALLESGRRAEVREYALDRDELKMYCAGRATVLIEAHAPEPEIVIFGGGHVGEALGRLAAETGLFRTALVDDREVYAARARHPRIDRVLQTDPLYCENLPRLGPWTYAVLVTRCHDVDKALLRRLAAENLAYLGMIGSRSKAAAILRELEEEGVPRERLERVRAPIGLPLGETKEPGAIAVSILAEIVKVLNERHARPKSAGDRGG
jgi:xanthine dehydrogenase accessory factor